MSMLFSNLNKKSITSIGVIRLPCPASYVEFCEMPSCPFCIWRRHRASDRLGQEHGIAMGQKRKVILARLRRTISTQGYGNENMIMASE
jgi:hypothetical protein